MCPHIARNLLLQNFTSRFSLYTGSNLSLQMLLQVDFSPYIGRNLSLQNATTFPLFKLNFQLPIRWLTHTELSETGNMNCINIWTLKSPVLDCVNYAMQVTAERISTCGTKEVLL